MKSRYDSLKSNKKLYKTAPPLGFGASSTLSGAAAAAGAATPSSPAKQDLYRNKDDF